MYMYVYVSTSFHLEFIVSTQDLSPEDFTDLINNSLIEPMRAYNPLDTSNVPFLMKLWVPKS